MEEKFYAKFATLHAGLDCQKEYVKENLILGNKYEIDEVDIYSCHTDVYLKGFNKRFNSVFFEFYDEEGNEYDLLDLPIANHFY